MKYYDIRFALKNLKGNKLFTITSVLSFSTALSSTIFILLFIFNELSFDRQHQKHDRIYRLESDFSISDRNQKVAKTPYAFGPAFIEEFPEVESFTRFFPMNGTVVKYGEKAFYEENILYADSSVFQVFDYDFLEGNPATCLTNQFTMVLTESFARKYFGNECPLGKTLQFQNGLNCAVTGVIGDVPQNSHLKFEALVSFSSQAQILGADMFHALNTRHFWAIRLFTYVLLKEGATMDNIHRNFGEFYQKYMDEFGKQLNGSFQLMSQRLDQIHLSSTVDWDYPRGSSRLLWILGGIAFAILLLAGINHTNIATVQSESLTKTIGIRKIFGVSNRRLSFILLFESVVIASISLLLAILICYLLLPVFNRITTIDFDLITVRNLPVYTFILIITVFTGLLSGCYPAFYLSSLQPIAALKGKILPSHKTGNLRKGLIVFQFAVTVAMLVAIITINRQVSFMMNNNPGFEPRHVIAIPMVDSAFNKKYFAFKKEMLLHAEIEYVSTSSGIPGAANYMDIMHFEGNQKMEEQVITFYESDFGLNNLLRFKFISGRDFNPELSTDIEQSAIINKTLAEKFGWGENAVGKKIERRFGNRKTYRVIGVVDDFNFTSLHNEVTPLVMFLTPEPYGYLLVKMNQNSETSALKTTNKLWTQFCPSVPFDYLRLDTSLHESYKAENNLLNIIIYFTVLSLFIALLGLFSFSLFVTEKFTREIGIRKAFGASSADIFKLLLTKFAVLVIASNMIAWPVAEIIIRRWLDGFAYKVALSYPSFLFASAIALVVALLTVSIQTARAASKRPFEILKYE